MCACLASFLRILTQGAILKNVGLTSYLLLPLYVLLVDPIGLRTISAAVDDIDSRIKSKPLVYSAQQHAAEAEYFACLGYFMT